ncbi:hypothetical protein MRX96_027283 [Rhipicephalus microplus]
MGPRRRWQERVRNLHVPHESSAPFIIAFSSFLAPILPVAYLHTATFKSGCTPDDPIEVQAARKKSKKGRSHQCQCPPAAAAEVAVALGRVRGTGPLASPEAARWPAWRPFNPLPALAYGESESAQPPLASQAKRLSGGLNGSAGAQASLAASSGLCAKRVACTAWTYGREGSARRQRIRTRRANFGLCNA